MPFTDGSSLRSVELRDRAFAKLQSPSDPSEDQIQDVDARRLALLGKKQRLQVRSKWAKSPIASLMGTTRGSGGLEESLWSLSPQLFLLPGNP